MPLRQILAAVRRSRRAPPERAPTSELADLVRDGQPNGLRERWSGHPAEDWTAGCVAFADDETREVWSRVPTVVRVPVHP